jgi:hypothetical protein
MRTEKTLDLEISKIFSKELICGAVKIPGGDP